jgi:HNH endonuclease
MQKTNDNKKYCPVCKNIKEVTDFSKDKSKSDGLSCICKKCKRIYRTSESYHTKEIELEKTDPYKLRRRNYKHTIKGHHYQSRKSHNEKRKVIERGDLTYEQWNFILQCQDNRCAICMRPFSIELKSNRDCIIPLSKGGVLEFSNTQALCRSCNAKKHTSIYMGLLNRWRGSLL